MIRLYYLGGLCPQNKKSFIVTVSNKPIIFQNMVGAYNDVDEIEAKVIIRNHKVIRGDGKFEAFTTNKAVIDQIYARRKRKNDEVVEQRTIETATKEELIAALTRYMDEESQELEPEGVGT